MNRLAGIVAFTFSGMVAALVLVEPNRRTHALPFGDSRVSVLYDSAVSTATLGIVVAVLVAAYVGQREPARIAMAVGLVGIALSAVIDSNSLTVQYLTGACAGLVLGGASFLAGADQVRGTRKPWPAVSLGVGVVIGLLCAHSVRSLRFVEDRPRRYADYLPSSTSFTGPADRVVVVLAVLAVAALAFTVARSRGADDVAPAPRPAASRWAVVGGCALPVGGLIAHWLLVERAVTSGGSGLQSWSWGYLLAAAALVLAVMLPGRSGLLWVAVVAVIVTGAVNSFSADDGVIIGITVVTVLVGAAVGYVAPQPLWGIAVLGLCTIVAYGGPSWELGQLFAVAFVLPAATAFTIVAALPSNGTVTASALGIPAVFTASVGIEFGWTAYTPLTDAHSLDVNTSTATTTTLTLVSLVGCAVVVVLLGRRSRAE